MTKKQEMIFECRTCGAYKEHPDNPDQGECRRRAPTPLVMHWPEKPEVDEHGRILGYRCTCWPAVSADDGCCEFVPGPEVGAQLLAQMESATNPARH